MENVNVGEIIPVCIIGGGPAGIATALSLINRGIKATVIESNPTVVPKIGETLPPGAIPLLNALGIADLLQNEAHLTSFGNTWLWGNNKVQDQYFMQNVNGNGCHLRRDVFESGMIAEAVKRGVNICSGQQFITAEQTETGIWEVKLRLADGSQHTLKTQLLVDASGRSSKVGRINKVRRHRYDNLTGVVARFRPEIIPLSRQTHIESTPDGWWYAAVLSDGEIVTVFMTDDTLLDKKMQSEEGYREALNQTHLIRTVFAGGLIPQPLNGIQVRQAGTSRLAILYGNNWIAVGDAAQSYDPVSSYGITSSLGSGYYAGHAIADHLAGEEEAFQAYRQIMETTFSDYLKRWKYQYHLEQRWNDQPFWSIRSSV